MVISRCNSSHIATPIIYVRLLFLWIGVISLDILCGFRFELLYPFWLILRKGYEAVHKNHNAVVTLANHNTAKFSVLFVCVTATSDLICYLFIPVKFLVFIASTYVWVHVIWHSHGGFLRTLSAMIYGKLCSLVFWVFIVAFEAGIRLKFVCLQTQGLAPVIPRSLNLFFGAHCIGYPLVIVSFSLRYYFKEWRIRRKQDDVCRQNELMARILTEALPAVYEGPKDYTAKNFCKTLVFVRFSISTLEAEKLRAEVMQLKTAEADARIQLSVSQNNEKHAKQEAVQLRSRLEQMEARLSFNNRYITMEKLRDIDRSSLSQLEKKYAELMNRKNDVERELMDERKARKEDGGKRYVLDSVEQQREKERQLEQEVDRLRAEALSREERVNDVEKELYALRKYKEMNDIEALNMDLRIMREKMVHLEESLAAENKLKQELFRALGDAKANNAHLQSEYFSHFFSSSPFSNICFLHFSFPNNKFIVTCLV
uniref:Macoilin n=1 Tax=Angiostrongylus cantonensis TaxID=6313 RepID=A0A0K0CZ82_ANGCA